MKYIINEIQYKKLEEISISRGDTYAKEIFEPIIQYLLETLGMERLIRRIELILQEKFNLKTNKIDNFEKKMKDFINSLLVDHLSIKGKKLNFVSDPETFSQILYILFKEQRRMENYGRLSFFVDSSPNHSDYFFFAEDRYIGFIKTVTMDSDEDFDGRLPSNTKKIVISALEPMMKGMGYGKEMYLAIISRLDALLSDNFLFEESLAIWLHALPKNVWVGFFVNGEEKAEPVGEFDRYDDHEIDCFIATKKRSVVNSIT